MRALDRKLLRDLGRMWSQALTIALVVASGVGGFIATLSAVDSLAAPVAGSKTSSPPCSVMDKATDLEQGHEGSALTPTSTISSLACSVADSVADKPVPDQDLAPDSAPTPQAQDKTLTRPRRCRSEAR